MQKTVRKVFEISMDINTLVYLAKSPAIRLLA